MKRLYFNIDKENNKVILDRKDFDYLMSIGHYNDKAIEYLEDHTYDKNGECGYTPDWEVRELYDILKGNDKE